MTTRADDDNTEPPAPRTSLPARIAAGISALANATLDMVVPPLCLACRKPLGTHDALCPHCWRQISFIHPPLCDRLGTPLPFDTGTQTVSAAALANPPDYDRARAVAQFGPVMRNLIHGFKYADRHDARRLFGRWLTGAGREILADADLLVPVPLHRWRLLRRKFNQSTLLAQEISHRIHLPVEHFALERVKATPQQVGLSQAERRRNVSGAFRVPPAALPRIANRNIVLIDDVITTGTTISACARALRRAGAARIDVMALALVTEESRLRT